MNPDNTPNMSIGKRFDTKANLLVYQQLESCVTWEVLWDVIEEAEPSIGPRCRYNFMDVVVMEIAGHLFRSNSEAAEALADPPMWAALRSAVERAFPDNPQRRLSTTAPSRQQRYRARQALTGERLDALQRRVRREAVLAARRLGLFDPAAGTWTHPDATQVVAGDATWIPTVTCPRRMAAPTGGVDDRRRVVVLVGGTDHTGRILLDGEISDRDRWMGRRDGDEAVAMLKRLLDENDDILRGGLKGFCHDMGLTSANLDDILEMSVLPVAKVPRAAGGDLRRGVIGMHSFTSTDGASHDLQVGAVNGSPVVEFSDNSGTVTTVALRRQQIWWAVGSQRTTAYGRYQIPATAAGVPTHLGGATTVIRLNSSALGTRGVPDTRRTRLVRSIPETDDDFDRLYGIRGQAEAMSADLKHRGGPRRLHTFQLITYQILCIARVLRTRDNPASDQAA